MRPNAHTCARAMIFYGVKIITRTRTHGCEAGTHLVAACADGHRQVGVSTGSLASHAHTRSFWLYR
jgi:hypothetical protein